MFIQREYVKKNINVIMGKSNDNSYVLVCFAIISRKSVEAFSLQDLLIIMMIMNSVV